MNAFVIISTLFVIISLLYDDDVMAKKECPPHYRYDKNMTYYYDLFIAKHAPDGNLANIVYTVDLLSTRFFSNFPPHPERWRMILPTKMAVPCFVHYHKRVRRISCPLPEDDNAKQRILDGEPISMTWDTKIVVDNEVVCYNEELMKETHKATIALMTLDHLLVIEEFLEYHLMIGIEKFYIYAFLDVNLMSTLLKSYIDAGTVVVYDWTTTWPVRIAGRPMDGVWIPYQILAINDALIRHGRTTTWIGFVDPDEYIVPVPPYDSIPAVLDKYTGNDILVSALSMNSLKFACNANELSLPNSTLVIERCQKHDNDFTRLERLKTFVRSPLVSDISVHWPQQRRLPMYTLDSNTEMYFNHYHRGLPDSARETPILRFIPGIRSRMDKVFARKK